MYANIYLYDVFLGSCDHEKYPALFDPSRPDHETLQSLFSDQIEAYADQCLTGSMPEGAKTVNGQQFADLLQYADHDKYIDRIADGATARLPEARIRKLIASPGMAGHAAALKAAPARLGSGTRIYDDIRKGLEALGRMHEPDRQAARDALASGGDVKSDPERAAGRMETMRTTLEKMDQYLNNKTKLKAQKGSLGANGERRYRVMQEAREALRKEYDLVTSVNKNGLSAKDREDLPSPLKVDVAALQKEAANKVQHLNSTVMEKRKAEEIMKKADNLAKEATAKQLERINSLHPEPGLRGPVYKAEVKTSIVPLLFTRFSQNLAHKKNEYRRRTA